MKRLDKKDMEILDIAIGMIGVFLILLGISNFLELSLNRIMGVWVVMGIILIVVRFSIMRKLTK